MILQGDPVQDLGPIGDAWTGVVYPAVTLALSVLVSWYLYWHFVRKRRHEGR
ncbi:MAG: hypothetical protein HYT80_04500 [Euryarchaeota archaeon]|nr:hypothetical protein [Euryarchaeota archaeon]